VSPRQATHREREREREIETAETEKRERKSEKKRREGVRRLQKEARHVWEPIEERLRRDGRKREEERERERKREEEGERARVDCRTRGRHVWGLKREVKKACRCVPSQRRERERETEKREKD